jgi:hypothetical protein
VTIIFPSSINRSNIFPEGKSYNLYALKTKLRHVILMQFPQLGPSAAVLTISKLFLEASIKIKISKFYPSAVATRRPSAAT